MTLEFRSFDSKEALAAAFAVEICGHLQSAIASKGQASLALSGGSTPRLFLSHLGQSDLTWEKVQATLVDDRWVDETSPRSNLNLLRQTLLTDQSAALTLFPLFEGSEDPETALPAIEKRLDGFSWPLDLAVLGMGLDGHTASFFPGGDKLSEALDLSTKKRVIAMKAAGAGEPRITLTLASLLQAQRLYLHIEGEEKRDLYEQCLEKKTKSPLPIASVLHQEICPLTVFWAP